jgi:hypothetical protein
MVSRSSSTKNSSSGVDGTQIPPLTTTVQSNSNEIISAAFAIATVDDSEAAMAVESLRQYVLFQGESNYQENVLATATTPNTPALNSRLIPLDWVESITPIYPIAPIKEEPVDDDADVIITACYNARTGQQCQHCQVALLCKICNGAVPPRK